MSLACTALPRLPEHQAIPRESEFVATTRKAEKKKGSQRTAKTASPVKRDAEAKSTVVSGESTGVAVMDRRSRQDRRRETDRRRHDVPVATERRKLQRRVKVNRRRQIDPTTCERDYTAEEIEFMTALDAYKRTSGRMFPTCSEILEVVRKLGYERRAGAEATVEQSPDPENGPVDVVPAV